MYMLAGKVAIMEVEHPEQEELTKELMVVEGQIYELEVLLMVIV